jgi:hypothetical protein
MFSHTPQTFYQVSVMHFSYPPQCGSTLYARLEIWKAACTEVESQPEMSTQAQWNSSNNSSGSSGEVSEGE